MSVRRHLDRTSSGQTIVIFALALVALIAMAGLILDGGNAFAQQRRAQNATDAAAEAGAVELARRMSGLDPAANWDQRVLDAVNAVAAQNGLTTTANPNYTDIDGNVVGPVGTGTIPANTWGVQAGGTLNFRTYLAGVVGFGSFDASATATAVTGYVQSVGVNGLIPLTFPIILTQCETGGGSNRLYQPVNPDNPEGLPWPYGPENMVALPLCSNGPGNVGWIDWDPKAGGASDVAASILTPDNPPITTPKWYFVAETGGITSLDAPMDTWEGRDILIPIFYTRADDPSTPADESVLGTCDTDPTGDMTKLGDCPAGHNGGSGSNQWYYLVTFGKFHLEHSYIKDNHQVQCNDPSLASTASVMDGSPGAQIKNCLIGYFKEKPIISNSTVGTDPGETNLDPLGVQLIK